MHAKTLPFFLMPLLAATQAARRLAAWLLRERSAAPGGLDELMRMSDRELVDLGIGRSEIPHVLGPPNSHAGPARPGSGRGGAQDAL